LSFALDHSPDAGRIVLRSKWETGRRFELARLLGDRIAGGAVERLFPATRAYTYRQKLQRSFAAELLSPFEAVAEMLHGDHSSDKLEEIAEHFNVSPFTIRTLLVNHGVIARDDLDGEFEAASA
jgi:Zn-dependent peptidase ImmA (M78 family)